ncbi:hypothetical protein K474DRAFT_1582616, partial [Panus rudis PR-1116 ss-1]
LLIGLSSHELDSWCKEYSEDTHFGKILEALAEENNPSKPQFPQYFMGDNGLLYFEDYDGSNRLCVPDSRKMEIIKTAHDSITETAHGG